MLSMKKTFSGCEQVVGLGLLANKSLYVGFISQLCCMRLVFNVKHHLVAM